MPRIEKQFTLEVTVERFIDACSTVELHELDMLMCSPRIRARLNPEGTFKEPKTPRSKQLRIPDA